MIFIQNQNRLDLDSSKMIDPIGSNLNSVEKTDRYLESIQIPLVNKIL